MKIIKKLLHKDEEKCGKCNWKTFDLYSLDGWEEDYLCGNCFLEELIESEADYQVIPSLQLKKGKL